MRSRRAVLRRPSVALPVICIVALVAAACGGSGNAGPAEGADLDRPEQALMTSVRLDNVAAEVGIDFRHGAFQWGTTGDTNAMMSGGLCWIDADSDGWLDLFVVNTWSNGEWGRWRDQGGLPSTRLYRNERGTFTDVTEAFGAGLEVRGNGCVAADLDLDGHTDLYVTTERDNVLLWNNDGQFEADDGSAGAGGYGWQSGAAVGDVNGDGWPDLFVVGYVDLNHPIPTDKGFPNPFQAEPDLLLLSQGSVDGERPTFLDVATEVGVEAAQLDYGLGAVFADVDRDNDLDLYVANDTQPNRLYLNEPDGGAAGFRLEEQGGVAGVDDEGAGMGVAASDYDGDGRPDLVVTNMTREGHAVFQGVGEPGAFRLANDDMGLPDLGEGDTGWGVAWADLDLDGDLDLVLAHGTVPVTDLVTDREQLRVYENGGAGLGVFTEATREVGLEESGRHLARGLAMADYDNDGDVDLAVGTIGGDLALLRNTGAGGHWLLVEPEPATPGTRVLIAEPSTGSSQERGLVAGSSYLSSHDPRAHFGLGTNDRPVSVSVTWSDGTVVELDDVQPDQLVAVTKD